MKNCLFLLSFIVFACGPTACLEKEDFYLGIEGQINRMGCKKNFGDLIVRKNHYQSNFYVGYRINENIALELGREETSSKVQNSRITTGEAVNGISLPSCLDPACFRTKIKVRGPHLDLVFSKRVSDKFPVSVLGSIGISSLTIICQRDLVQMGNPPIEGPSRHMKKRSAALRAMGGLQYEFNNGIGVRLSLSFVNTGRMVVKVKDPSARKLPVMPKIRPKDTLLFGAGLIIPF
jgi:hypothetical protein